MCIECVNALVNGVADCPWTVPDAEIGDFLISCTCFPFGKPSDVAVQIADLVARFGDAKTWDEFRERSHVWAEALVDEAMRDARERHQAEAPQKEQEGVGGA